MKTGAAVGCALLLAAPSAWGQTTVPSARPCITVSFADASLPKEQLLAELDSELGDLDIALCQDAPAPIARIEFVRESQNTVHILLHDAVTSKEVGRSMDLSKIPADARGAALAAATVELVRASWVELAVPDAPPPVAPPPPAVRAVVARSLPHAPAAAARPFRTFRIELAGVVDTYASGLVRTGGDVRLGAQVFERVGIDVRFGARHSRSVSAPDGVVRPTTLLGGLGVTVSLTSPAWRLGLDVTARVDAGAVSFDAKGLPGAQSHTGSLAIVEMSAGPRLRFAASRWLETSIEVDVGGPLLSATAYDGNVAVLSSESVLVSTSLALRASF